MTDVRGKLASLLLAVALSVAAEQPSDLENAASPAPVTLEGEMIFMLHTAYGGVSAQDRAAAISKRLDGVAENKKLRADLIRAEDIQQKGTLILLGDTIIMAVSDDEAAAAGKPRAELASEIVQKIRQAIQRYRDAWSPRNLLIGTVYALAASVILYLLLVGLSRLHRFAKEQILERTVKGRRLQRLYASSILSPGRIAVVLLTIEGVLRWLIILVLIQAYLAGVFSSFPATAHLPVSFYSLVFTPLRVLWGQFVAYLPSLFFVIVVSLATFYVLKLNRFLFGEIRDGKLSIGGFYADLADPTARLVSILIVALAVLVVFPYLPGSGSDAFKGITIFLGVLISFGSSSVVGNAVSGTVLTYMRPYQLGDRVQIADTYGDVVEKSLFVTRVRTIKNVVISIPNANILSSHILNYSTMARQQGLILPTSVTIGYSAPWRTVHELLINAALSTSGVLAEPRPFVFQTALNDFYVSYQINAYISDANHRDDILSDLHQRIQDKFNEAGVEIMSPHNFTLRDGNPIAIPENYYPEGYRPPSFRVNVEDLKP